MPPRPSRRIPPVHVVTVRIPKRESWTEWMRLACVAGRERAKGNAGAADYFLGEARREHRLMAVVSNYFRRSFAAAQYADLECVLLRCPPESAALDAVTERMTDLWRQMSPKHREEANKRAAAYARKTPHPAALRAHYARLTKKKDTK